MSGATRRLANKQANKSILSRDLGGRACGGSAHDEERSCEGGRAFDFERFGAKGWAKAGHAAQASPNLANRYLSEFVVSGEGPWSGNNVPVGALPPHHTTQNAYGPRASGRHDDTLKTENTLSTGPDPLDRIM